MAIDSSIVAALQAAVESDPDNGPLRIHLIELLLRDGQAETALEHCSAILNKEPAHLQALGNAAQAAAALGYTERADGYSRLHAALSGQPAVEANDPEAAGVDPTPPLNLESGVREEEAKSEHGNVVRMRLIQGGDDSSDIVEAEAPTIKLADVAGMDEVKRRLNLAFLAPLKNPAMMKAFGKSTRGGLLLYGPPGCGKTFIARATAGELGAKFISVGLPDVLDMWIGSSERNLHEIFETARRNSPCVLFFDEVDALGRKRSLVRNSPVANVINQLLAEMDSLQGNNKGLFILAATNHPWDVDTALRRPGRLDRTLLVLPPDKPARASIVHSHLRDRPIQELDVGWIAEKTDEFSGADLAYLCEAAAEFAMEASLQTGKVRPITMADFKQSMKELKPSTRPWFDTARNYAMFSNEGGVYDDLLDYLRVRRLL